MPSSKEPSPALSHPWRWFPEFLDIVQKRSRTQAHMLGASILVGIVAGLGAIVFSVACQLVVRYSLDGLAGYRAEGPSGEARVDFFPPSTTPFHPWLLFLIPALGGLASAYLVFRFAPEAEGHGTDSVIAAYHNKQGSIRARVPLIKLLASALTIGTGGSGGREGPIAQIGAGFGSVLGKMLRFRPAHRRILVAAGMGAGIAAIFRAPLAGALFASEVLYRSPEFEPEVIMPAGLASVVAYSTFGLAFGWKPLFDTPNLVFNNAWQLVPYTLLAVAMAMLAMLYTRGFSWITALSARVRLPRMIKPAIGAALSGLIGICLYFSFRDILALSVLSFGYGILQKAMRHLPEMSPWLLLAVAVGKILTTSLTIGSGGSGGVFGPSMIIGGCGGGALGVFFYRLWPALVPEPQSFMIVGMAGFFAAAAKTPFSTLIIVCELTGNYELIVPALWVCTLSYLLSDEQSLYRSQVENRSASPAHRGFYVHEVLAGQTVGQVIKTQAPVVSVQPDASLDTVIGCFDQTSWLVLPVVDRDNRLLGIIHLYELHWTANRRDTFPWLVAADLMRSELRPLTPEDPLERAVEVFADYDIPELPVVNDAESRTLLGMVRRTDIAREYLRRVHGIYNEEAASGSRTDLKL